MKLNKHLKNYGYLYLLGINTLIMVSIAIYLKILDGNWNYKDIGFNTMIEHWKLSTWMFSHLLLHFFLYFKLKS